VHDEKEKEKKKNENIMDPIVKVENALEDCDLNVSLPASSLAKANESVDVASILGEKENAEGNKKTNPEVPLEPVNGIMDEELIVGGNDDEEEEQELESEDDYEANILVQARCMLCDIDRDEFITFQKIYLNNGDVGYVSLRGEFYRFDVCSKHHHGEVQRMLMQTTASNPKVIIYL